MCLKALEKKMIFQVAPSFSQFHILLLKPILHEESVLLLQKYFPHALLDVIVP